MAYFKSHFAGHKNSIQRIFMMPRKNGIKQAAIFLILAYFLVSNHVYMMPDGERHALNHGQHSQQVAHNVSSLCNWICGASTFVFLSNPDIKQRFNLSSNRIVHYNEPFSDNLSFFFYHDRSPPVLLS
jgi:hypothetical protein